MKHDVYDHNLSKKIDLIYMLVILMFFVLILIFTFIDLDENPYGIYMIFITMLGAVIGYYANVTASILYGILFIFLYGSIHIFANVTNGISVSGDLYIWMLIVPIFPITLAYYGSLIGKIQAENLTLKKENSEYIIIDKDTGLMSSQTFFNELQTFIKINERYNIEVYLMVIRIRYEDQLIGILGKAKYEKMINEMSKAIHVILREEDRKYILRDMHLFACILLSNKDGGNCIKSRMKETISKITFGDDKVINKIKLETQIGLVTFDRSEFATPYDFFKAAEKDLEFDV